MDKNFSLLNSVQDDSCAESGMIESFLDNDSEAYVEETLNQNESLMTTDDAMSFVELNNDILSDQEIENRRKFFSSPKNQAQILLNNYLKEQHVCVNHSQRRKLYADFLRNAKKGKYRKIFSIYINGTSKEESQKNFSKLNG